MSLVLTEREQAHLAATARTLLSPLDVPVDQWRADVLDRLTNLFGVDAGGFMMPVGDGIPYTLRCLPEEFGREYLETYPGEAGRSVEPARRYLVPQGSPQSPRVGVLFGGYEQRAQAAEALAGLPQPLRQFKPYVRSLDSLREEARRAQGQ